MGIQKTLVSSYAHYFQVPATQAVKNEEERKIKNKVYKKLWRIRQGERRLLFSFSCLRLFKLSPQATTKQYQVVIVIFYCSKTIVNWGMLQWNNIYCAIHCMSSCLMTACVRHIRNSQDTHLDWNSFVHSECEISSIESHRQWVKS